MQILVSEQRRGRIAAIAMTCLMGGMATSAPIFGLIADAYGPRACLIIGGAGAVVGSGLAYGWYRARLRRGVVLAPGSRAER